MPLRIPFVSSVVETPIGSARTHGISTGLDANGFSGGRKLCQCRQKPGKRLARSRGRNQQGMPTLARGSALRFLLTRAYDWLNTPKDALVKPHDPGDYVHRLKLHRGIADAAQYGLETA